MVTFILGAGFNIDAISEAGPFFGESLWGERYQIECGYPLIADMSRLCFGTEHRPDESKSIEVLFAEAIERGDYRPLTIFANCLRKADYYIARRLAVCNKANSYARFFRDFKGSHFLTFNYDSLAETFLFQLGIWNPRDGYGVSVEAGLPPAAEEFASRESRALVLHLHGSLCIRTSET
ncbi:MAG TPA: hypothetical protein VH639_20130 [Bryobacteraceae bacterium]|jgi:hypothetical protein